jgi:hypothetical protein
MFIKNLAIIFTVLISLYGRGQSNSLIIFSNVGHVFSLTVNNKQINGVPETNVKAYNLGLGWQNIKLSTVLNNNEIMLIDSFFISDKYTNKEFTYVLSESADKLTFNSIELPSAPARPNVPEVPIKEIPLVDNSIYGKLYHSKNNKPIFFNNYHFQTETCDAVLTDLEISYALNLLSKCKDDELVLSYLNSILENNCYSAKQLNQLVSVLKLELDILNGVKKGYAHVIDKENIHVLLHVLKYESMKNAFSHFLQEQTDLLKQKSMACRIAISDQKFNEVMNFIKGKKYENERTDAAKKQLYINCVSTSQAQKIMTLFSHDREKIEVLKSAYYAIIDKENVLKLINEFQFQETRDEFSKFLDSKK